MKSVRYWRLWHRLFGWDYAQFSSFYERKGVLDKEPYAATIRRVWIGVDGRRYFRGFRDDVEFIMPVDDALRVLPLTWVSENDTLHAFADLVQKQLQEE